jgi:RNA polymerase sigma-70 factor (ECF subfamily)
VGTEARAGFEALWESHHRRVHAYALRRTDPASAQDAVSETFLVAWRRRAEMPPEPLPWLLGVARLVLANQARSQRRQIALADVLFATAQAQRDDRDIDTSLFAALAGLGERDREALLLVGWDGLTSAEAAVALGCSATAFRVRLLRARRRLRQALDQPVTGQAGLEVEAA